MFHSSNAKMAWAESTRQESNYLRFPHLAVATWLEIPVLLAPTGTTRYQLFPTKEHCRTGLILMKIYKKKEKFRHFQKRKKILTNQRSKIRIFLNNNNNILKISVFSKCYGVKNTSELYKAFFVMFGKNIPSDIYWTKYLKYRKTSKIPLNALNTANLRK